MSLWFRMLYVWILAYFRERLPVGPARSVLVLRVLPNDLDINFHVNNGRFLTLCDLNRMDLFIRTGLLKVGLPGAKEGLPRKTRRSPNY